MDPMLEKSFSEERALLFGLIQECIFSEYALEDCPLLELRDSLTSLADKYAYVMQLGDNEVNSLLRQHEECIAERGATRLFPCFLKVFRLTQDYKFPLLCLSVPSRKDLNIAPCF
jgi:hypothetical protein